MTYASNAPYSSKAPEGYSQGKMNNFTPEQMQLFSQMFGHVGPNSFTSKLAQGDQQAFQDMERPALQQFNGIQGNIASRFSGMGMGGRKSSGFQNTMNSAASDFASNLQSQRMSYQQQAIKDLMGMSSELLGQRPFENYLVEKPRPWYEQAAIGAAEGVGQGLGQSAGKFVTGGF